jgi:hypothetical protein
MEVILWILMGLIALLALPAVMWVVLWVLAFWCDTGWTGRQQKAGPLPLSSAGTPIVRLVEKRSTFETDYTRLLWDEGNGPIEPVDRIKPLIDSVPKEFRKRMYSTKKVPAKLFPGLHDDTGTYDAEVYHAWGIVVSLNPDVLIVSVHEQFYGSEAQPCPNWDRSLMDKARSEYIDRRIEHIAYLGQISAVDVNTLVAETCRICAGTLIPWSKEMHVFSTDRKIKNGRLMFDNDQATVLLPAGKLVLRRHDDDVDVTRQ